MVWLSHQNLYRGMNIHLNGFLQTDAGEWESFHADHIADLATVLDAQLPQGYFIRTERGLQLSAYHVDDNITRTIRLKPDMTVYQNSASSTPLMPNPRVMALEIADLVDTFPDFDDLMGLTIYQRLEHGNHQPITRLELLSHANKPAQSHYKHYLAKRRQTLAAALCLVEIDYLHQTPAIAANIAPYPKGRTYPYVFLVNDPRPSYEAGLAYTFAGYVDEPLPLIPIPLAGDNEVMLNLQDAYNRTFTRLRFYRELIDYAQDPADLATFSPADQERIRQRLALIRQQFATETR